MKRKWLWVLGSGLACGALVYLTLSAAQPPDDLEKFRAAIKEKRQALGAWLNTQKGDLKGIVAEKAVAINPLRKEVGHSRLKIEAKWKEAKKPHPNQKIRFDTDNVKIEFVDVAFQALLSGTGGTQYKYIAIEFGTYTFETETEAQSGPSAAPAPLARDYCAIWGHMQSCSWEIFAEIEN